MWIVLGFLVFLGTFGLAGACLLFAFLVMMAESGSQTNPALCIGLIGASVANLIAAGALAWRFFRRRGSPVPSSLVVGFSLMIGSVVATVIINPHSADGSWAWPATLCQYVGALLAAAGVWRPEPEAVSPMRD